MFVRAMEVQNDQRVLVGEKEVPDDTANGLEVGDHVNIVAPTQDQQTDQKQDTQKQYKITKIDKVQTQANTTALEITVEQLEQQ